MASIAIMTKLQQNKVGLVHQPDIDLSQESKHATVLNYSYTLRYI